MAMGSMHGWSAAEAAGLFAMWAVMMVAMMLPSAAPMILLFASVERRRRELAAAAARGLRGRLPPGLVRVQRGGRTDPGGAAPGGPALPRHGQHHALPRRALLLTAGLWQWFPIKQACLQHCRSPIHFLQHEWREGVSGAVRMGLGHGVYCLGCCWALMALLFVGGVMNLLWVAGIAGLVLVEKVARAGPWVGRVAGLALAGWGISMLAAAVG